MKATANGSGWFALRLTGHGLPAIGTPYALTVTYTGTQEFTN
jgi:hypothetical protein